MSARTHKPVQFQHKSHSSDEILARGRLSTPSARAAMSYRVCRREDRFHVPDPSTALHDDDSSARVDGHVHVRSAPSIGGRAWTTNPS
jgi:hypothetical protein